MAIAAAAALALLPAPAYAGAFPWSGGMDSMGWSAPTQCAYFAEGTTRNGFEEYLILRNPSPREASVSVTYQFQAPDPSRAQALKLPVGAGSSISVNDFVGPEKDVSIAVASDQGIICERQVYFNYKGVWQGGHVSSGVAKASDTWYFAEGTTRDGFQEWLCLQNPSDTEARVTVTYMLGTGQNKDKTRTIAARSRLTVDVREPVGLDQDVSIKVQADKPIIAERPIYFDYKSAWRGGHTACGATALAREWFFAEGTTRIGFEEWLSIMNPGAATTARVEYIFPDRPAEAREYALKERARTTIFVNAEIGAEKDVSMRVTTGGEVLCERPMYFLYHGAVEGGHVVMGSTAGAKEWQFACSATGDGFEPYLCVMNPGAEGSSVKVEIIGDGGGYHKDELFMGPRSRSTINLTAACQNIVSPWIKVTGERDIIVERPAYFSYIPKVAPEPFTFATCNGVELKCPISYCDLLGCIFHQAAADGGDGQPSNPQVMQPVGACLRDDNPSMLHPAINHLTGNDPAYFIEESRGRGTYSTTACDVQSKAGAVVLAPVSGTVLAAESYLLYGSYPDLRVKIIPDGMPGCHVAVLHMSTLFVSKGQRVEAGETQIGIVRDLVPYFHSGPNTYTREEGNHAHLQVNYRPD